MDRRKSYGLFLAVIMCSAVCLFGCGTEGKSQSGNETAEITNDKGNDKGNSQQNDEDIENEILKLALNIGRGGILGLGGFKATEAEILDKDDYGKYLIRCYMNVSGSDEMYEYRIIQCNGEPIRCEALENSSSYGIEGYKADSGNTYYFYSTSVTGIKLGSGWKNWDGVNLLKEKCYWGMSASDVENMPVQENTATGTEESSDNTQTENGMSVVDTEYYSLRVPTSMGECSYIVNENGYEDGYNLYVTVHSPAHGDVMFSVMMLEPDDTLLQDSRGIYDIGTLTAMGKSYELAFDIEVPDLDKYNEAFRKVDGIINAIEIKPGHKWNPSSEERVSMWEIPEHFYDMYGDYYNGEDILTLYLNDNNLNVEVFLNGERLGETSFVADDGHAYDYRGIDENGMEIVLIYDYIDNSVYMDSLYVNGENYSGGYRRE